MNDLNDLLERLGRSFEKMDRRFGGFGNFGNAEGRFGPRTEDDEPVETIERNLVFGEEPELYLSAGMMSVSLEPLKPGESARLVLSGRHARADELEIGTRDNGAVTVDVHPHYGWQTVDFRPWRMSGGHLRLTVYLPEGIRVHGRVDAGKFSVEGLRDAELDLRTDAGKLRIHDCTGRLRLASSAGKVSLSRVSGNLEAHTDAGAIAGEDVRLSGDSRLHANAGSINLSGVRFEAGSHLVETSLGSVRLALAADAPVRIETSATLGSINNSAGPGPADAPATLRVHTELGSIRVSREEAPATPLRAVPLTDARRPEGAPPAPARAEAEQPAPATATAPTAAPANEAETLRILGMVERHEITAGEAAALLTALRGGR